MSKILYIVGPTASGKSGLAVRIAKKYNGEIISADSRTIYKGLDIGTAKPSKAEQSGVAHYGFDLVEPNQAFSAAQFVRSAKKWIDEIVSRGGKLPIIVGGSGLYIDALYYDFSFVSKADEKLRHELGQKTIEQLHKIIEESDIKMPENSKNKRYLIRAIERGGEVGGKKLPDPASVIVGINPNRDVLKQRITDRFNKMIDDNVLDEVKQLYSQYGFDAPGSSGNIYRALRPYFDGEASLEECAQKFISLDMQLAKRQMTWLKRNQNIKWFETDKEAEGYLDRIL